MKKALMITALLLNTAAFAMEPGGERTVYSPDPNATLVKQLKGGKITRSGSTYFLETDPGNKWFGIINADQYLRGAGTLVLTPGSKPIANKGMYENFWSDEIPAETVYSYGVFRGIVRMKKLHTFTAAPLSDIEDLRFDTTALSNVNLFGNCRDGSIKLERAAEHVTVTIGPEVEKIRVLNLYGLKMSQVTLNFNGENQNLQALANDKNLELRQLDNGHVYTTNANYGLANALKFP